MNFEARPPPSLMNLIDSGKPPLKPPPPPIPPRRRGLDELLANLPQTVLGNMLAAANMPAPLSQSSPTGIFAAELALRHQASFRSLQPRRSMYVVHGEQKLRKYSSQPSLKRCRSLDSRRPLIVRNPTNRSGTPSPAGSIRRVSSALDLASCYSMPLSSTGEQTPSPILADYASMRSRSRGSVYRRNYFIPLLHVLPERQLQRAAVKTVLARHVVDGTDVDRVPPLTVCHLTAVSSASSSDRSHRQELIAVEREEFALPALPSSVSRRSVLLGGGSAANSRSPSPSPLDEPLVVSLELMEYSLPDKDDDDYDEDDDDDGDGDDNDDDENNSCGDGGAEKTTAVMKSAVSNALLPRIKRSAFDAALQSAVDASHLLTGGLESADDEEDCEIRSLNCSVNSKSRTSSFDRNSRIVRRPATPTPPGTIYLPTMSMQASRKWLAEPVRKRNITEMISGWPIQMAGILRIKPIADLPLSTSLSSRAGKSTTIKQSKLRLPSSLSAISWKRYWAELRQGCLFFYECPSWHRSTAKKPRSAIYPVAYLPVRSASSHTLSDRLTQRRIFRLEIEQHSQYFVQAASVGAMHNWWLDISCATASPDAAVNDEISSNSSSFDNQSPFTGGLNGFGNGRRAVRSLSSPVIESIERLAITSSLGHRRTNSDSHTLISSVDETESTAITTSRPVSRTGSLNRQSALII